MRRFLTPRFALSLMIFFGVMLIGFSVNDLWSSVSRGRIFGGETALAQSHEEAKPSEAKTESKAEAAPAEDKKAPPRDEDQIGEFSPAELEVLKQLAARRDELDRRAHELDTREALIKVGEQRVDQKIKEMETLRLQMQAMVDQISGAQAAQLDNLVKIYETMKPADAAKIFESLEMPVLLGVIQRMKPARSAPVLAAMAPDKAKEVTVALTKQDQLPAAK